MRDPRTELEKLIDEVVEKYAVNQSALQHIENGELSVLNAKYDVDFDNTQDHWCFRSARYGEVKEDLDYFDLNHYYPSTQSINRFLNQMMSDVSSAVNNSYFYKNEFKSYSKFLASPLFKYNKANGPFIIDELNLNSLYIRFDIHCHNWVGKDRLQIESYCLSIPFKELFSKKKLIERIYNEFNPNMMDVDDITLSISELTLDISEVTRKSFDDFNKKQGNSQFKRHASYKKDKEVLSTRKRPSSQAMVIYNSKVIQLLKFIYLLKIGFWYKEKAETFFSGLLAKLEREPKKVIQWILNYLGTDSAVRKEREVYLATFDEAPPSYYGYKKSDFVKYLWNLGCFDKEFAGTLLRHTLDD